jgi:hypothetical protein
MKGFCLAVTGITCLVPGVLFSGAQAQTGAGQAKPDWYRIPITRPLIELANIHTVSKRSPTPGFHGGAFQRLLAVRTFFITPATPDNWNAGTGNWSNAADWTAGIPNSSSAVTIGNTSNGYVTEDLAGASVASLSILSGNTLFIAPGYALTVGGATSVSAGGQLLVASSGTGGGTLNMGGSLTNAGYMQVGNGSLGGTSTANVAGTYTGTGGRMVLQGGNFAGSNALLNVGGAAPSILTGTYNVEGNVGSAAVEWGSGGITQIGDGGANLGIVYVTGTNAYLEVGATNTNSALRTLTTIAGNGELELDGGTSVTTTGALTVNTAGQLYVGETGPGGGTLNLGGSLTNRGYMQVGNGSLGGPSTVKVTGTYTGTGGRVIVQGGNTSGTNALLNITGAAPGILTGTYDVEGNGGSAAVKWSSGGITQIGDGGSNQGIVYVTGANAYLEIGATNSNSALKGLTSIAGNGELELDGGTSVTTTGALAVNSNGQLFVGDFGTGGGTLNVGGSLTNAGNMEIGNTGSGSAATVKVTGTYTNTGGKVLLQGGNASGSNALLNVSGAAPSILTGIYDVQGSTGSAVVKWGSGGITQIGDGGSNQGIVYVTGSNAYMEVGSTNSNSALKGLTTIASNGELELDGGTSVTTNGGLTVNRNGQLFVGDLGAGGGALNVGGPLTNGGALQVGNTGLGTGATVKVTGTYIGTGGKVTVVGGNVTGANALLHVSAAAPGTLTGTYDVEGHLGSAAVKWGSGGVTQIGDGGSNQGIVTVTGTDAYLEVGATNSNSALKGLATIASNGELELNGGASVTTTGALAVNGNGQLLVGDSGTGGASFKTGGSLTNSHYVQVGNTVLTSGASINVGTSLTNNATGTIDVYGGNVIPGGSVLEITGPTLANSGTINLFAGIGAAGLSINGNVALSGTGTINLSNNANNIISATVATDTLTNSSTIQGSGAIANLGIVNKGTIIANQPVPLRILPSTAGLNNQGTLSVFAGDTMQIGTSSGSALKNFSGTTLSGGTYSVGGTLQFGASGASIVTDAANISLAGTGARIIDFGDNNVLTNLATITSTGSFTLGASYGTFTTVGNFTNNGTLSVGAGDKFIVNLSHGLTNFSGTTLTGGSYSVSGTLQFAGANIVTNAANITLASSTAAIVNQSSTNALMGFTTNAAAGKFTLSGNAGLTTSGGSFTNAGLFTVSTGSTFKVGGSSFNFTQTAGTTTVDGTLAGASAGSLSLNGGSLFGTGTVNYGVVDAGTISPGDSVAQTGKLGVTGTYKQNSGGALDVTIGGTTAGATYDQLNVTSTATLGGTLNISLASGYTPAVGNTFDILNASSISGNFSTTNGLAINGSEHFAVTTVSGDEILLTVVAGAAPADTASLTQSLHAGLVHRSYGMGVFGGRSLPTTGIATFRAPFAAPSLARLAAAPLGRMLQMPRIPAASALSTPAATHGFRPMDEFGSPAAGSALASAGDAGGAGFTGISQVSAAASNSMATMNHMRFECGVDLKALLKTSRKQLVRALWAAPDSPEALAIGYMNYTTSH